MSKQSDYTAAEAIAYVGTKITAVYDAIWHVGYNVHSADGVMMDVDWWLKQYAEIPRRALLQAMARRAKAGTSATSSGPGISEHQTKHVQSARSAIRNHPELAGELLRDPEVSDAIKEARRIMAENAPTLAERKAIQAETEEMFAPLRETLRKLGSPVGDIIEDLQAVAGSLRDGRFTVAEIDQIDKALDEVRQARLNANITIGTFE